MKAEGYQVAVEPGRFIDDFLEQTVGLKVGAEKTIEVRFPKEYHAEDLQDKPAKFEIKINKISKAQKPALDDELAKKNKNPEAESLEDLKAKLSEKIKEEYENHKKALTENAIFEKLAEESKFEIPDDLVEKTMDVEYAKMAQMYGIDVEQIKQLMQAQGADPTKEKEMTKVRLANTLLLNGIMKAENFQHSDAETDEAWVEAQRNINNKSLNKSDFTYEIDVQLSTKKAKDLLINETKVSYVEKKPVAAEDETTEEVKEEAKA
jgi:trigger factor